MPYQLAQIIRIPGGTGQTAIEGPLKGLIGSRFTNLASIVNNFLPVIFGIAGVILLLYLTWGGFDFLTSMGDPKKAEIGKTKITHAVIGFVIIFVSFWLVQIINYLLKLQVY